MNYKTAYVLGAGFSIDAGSPPQKDFVKKILISKGEFGTDWMAKVQNFRNLLTNTFNIPPENHNDVPLEDIFTPLDRCIADNISFRDLTVSDVKRSRDLIYYLIGATLKELLTSEKKSYIDIFAEYLVEKCSSRRNDNYRDNDPIAIISTNWDILLDNSLKMMLDERFPYQGVVDYCCHISSFQPNDETVKPGLEMLGKGGFNVKYLKLHGSLNWLECPRCGRVYVDFGNKIAMDQYVTKEKCRHCNNHFGEHDSHILVSNLIMPTYLKNFNHSQFKLIWQNAGIELSEASKIVFIGYSLPQADFEMRQLLSRMIRTDAIIEVVDWASDENSPSLKETEHRFKTFFGNRMKSPVYHHGAKIYIEQNFGTKR
jgi:hypothetical protein